MKGFIVRLLIGAFALWVASAIVPGVKITGLGTLLLAALLLGVVNAVIRPVVIFLTLPATIVTLGLFLLVINAGMLALVAAMLGGFTLAGFWSALFGSIVVTLATWAASWTINSQGKVEIMAIEDKR